MARVMTVVSVTQPVLNEKGELLDKDGKIIDSSKKSKKDQEPAFEEVLYYLLHWGLTYEILVDKEARYPVSYTVGICQQIESGEIRAFLPTELKVIGKQHL